MAQNRRFCSRRVQGAKGPGAEAKPGRGAWKASSSDWAAQRPAGAKGSETRKAPASEPTGADATGRQNHETPSKPVGDTIKDGIEARANERDTADDHKGDQGSDEGVFDRSGAKLVPGKLYDVRHVIHFWFNPIGKSE
jgi:hypothetical protein